jgi:regulator of protease activity HflC (stomatin/prohibitin superfamily)
MGLGISFWCLPLIDRFYLIPSSAQSLSFSADQITCENQGVEVAGFAVWKIDDPQKASSNFDFSHSASALVAIGESLRNVVESAIRHQVANMTIEDVLRKRGSIILQLKKELSYMAGQWGLLIETVEIRNVRVLSEQLFKHMQAPFRDKLRLESEVSAIETEQLLVEKRLAQKEKIALQEQEFARRELERKSQDESMKIVVDARLQATRLDHQKELVASEEALHKQQAVLAMERHRHTAALAAIEDETRRKQIGTSNLEDLGLALVRQLPVALGALKVNELNLGDEWLQALRRGLGRALSGLKAARDE